LVPMGITSENVAEKFHVGRERQVLSKVKYWPKKKKKKETFFFLFD
jgi:hypothetical protein